MLLGHPLFPFHCACQAQPISVSANNAPCCTTAYSSPTGHELKQKLLAAPRDMQQWRTGQEASTLSPKLWGVTTMRYACQGTL